MLTAEQLKAYVNDDDLVERDVTDINEPPSPQARAIADSLPFAGLAVKSDDGKSVHVFRLCSFQPGFTIDLVPLAE